LPAAVSELEEVWCKLDTAPMGDAIVVFNMASAAEEVEAIQDRIIAAAGNAETLSRLFYEWLLKRLNKETAVSGVPGIKGAEVVEMVNTLTCNVNV